MTFSLLKASLLVVLAVCILSISSDAASLDKFILGRGRHDSVPIRRSAAEGSTASSGNSVSNSSFVLASERTKRRDPLNDFKYYTGGWNISNKHYWASVAFTAAPLFCIAAVWFIIFGLILIIVACCYCCCPRPIDSYSHPAYVISLILLLLFTLATILGCVLLYYGQGKFHKSSSNTLNYVVSQADFTVDNLRQFSANLSVAKNIKVIDLLIPADVQGRIDQIVSKVNSSSNDLSKHTSKNAKDIRDVLSDVRLVLIIVSAVMLLLALLGFLFSILGLQFLVYILVFIGWFLVAAMFIMSGVFLLLHNAVGDSCVAMEQWVNHPMEHTALDDILPCVDSATANESLTRSREVTFKLVEIVNSVINGVANSANSSIPYNQSGPLMPTLCNPFNQDLSNRACAAGEVDLSNASQVYKKYECSVTVINGVEICKTVGRVTPAIYRQMDAAITVGYALYHYVPFLVDLMDCTFVRQTFSSIDQNNCPGLKKYTNWVFVGLTVVSSAVLLSTIFWVIYARERRHRSLGRRPNFLMGSMKR